MSSGISLIKVLCRQGARSAFRRINPAHFIADERPCFDYVAGHYRTYGQLPTLEAMADNGFNLGLIRDNETADYYLDRISSRFIVLNTRNVIGDLQQAVIHNMSDRIREIVTDLAGVIRITTTGGAHRQNRYDGAVVTTVVSGAKSATRCRTSACERPRRWASTMIASWPARSSRAFE